MNLHDYPAGAVIFRAGDPADCAYLVRSGIVDLRRDGANETFGVARLAAGEIFGEMSLIEERPRSLTAIAAADVQLTTLSRSDFENLLTDDPETFRIYLKVLFERLRTLSAQAERAKSEFEGTRSGLTVTIHPLTRRAAATLPHDGLTIHKFPFRIGRAASEDEEIPLDLNDLWLNDQTPYNISRNHAMVECEGNEIRITDRGSSLGLYVNDMRIGGMSDLNQIALDDGNNVVVLGGGMSPYQFRINVERG